MINEPLDNQTPTADAAEVWLKQSRGLARIEVGPDNLGEGNFRIFQADFSDHPFNASGIFYRVAKTIGYPIQFSWGRRKPDIRIMPITGPDAKVLALLDQLVPNPPPEALGSLNPIYVYVDCEDTHDKLKFLQRVISRSSRKLLSWQLISLMQEKLYGGAYADEISDLIASVTPGNAPLIESEDRWLKQFKRLDIKRNSDLFKRCYVTVYEREQEYYSKYPWLAPEPVAENSLLAAILKKDGKWPPTAVKLAGYYLLFQQEGIKPITPEDLGKSLFDDIQGKVLIKYPQVRP